MGRQLPITENHQSQLDVSRLFQHAVELHQKGEFLEALDAYQIVAERQPNLPEVYFNMGLIHFGRKDWPAAVKSYLCALRHRPEWSAAWYNMAQAYEAANNTEDAVMAYQKALKIDPGYTEAAYNIGCIFLHKGNFKKAAQFFHRTIEDKPDHIGAHNNLGQAYRGLNNLPEANRSFLDCCQLNPEYGDAWFNLAEIHQSSGDFKKAIVYYQKAIQTQVNPCAAFNNLGNTYKRIHLFDQAAHCYRQVVNLQPELPEGHFNLGSVLRLAGNTDAALHHLTTAVQLRPDYAEAWNNLALTIKNMGDLPRARVCFDRAVQHDPHLAIARWNRAFVHLLEGRWQQGWQDFEWRFQIPQWTSLYPHRLNGKCWDGRPVAGRTILVHDEQGLGDTLQFARYLPLVRQRCGRLILETRQELVPLLDGFSGVDTIIVRSKTAPLSSLYDSYIPLMSLPRLFQTTPMDIPGRIPYLHAPQAKLDKWKKKQLRKGFTIGLVWSGRPEHTNDAHRSCALENFETLLRIKGVQFIGLQKGPAANQARLFSGLNGFFNIGEQLVDFGDTAGLLAGLDLILTVDTAVAHLAGAMGRPVWVLLPFIPDWRWMMKGNTTPWYPTIRLFRQTEPKSWPKVILNVKKALLSMMAATEH